MKRQLLRSFLFIVLILGVSAIFADDAGCDNLRIIGTEDNHTGNYEPWGSRDGYHRAAELYTAAEVGNAGSIITYAISPQATKTSINIPIKIYMKMTSSMFLSTSDTFNSLKEGAILVFTGTIESVHGGEWNTVVLNTPFAYIEGNLLILTESNYGGSGHANATYHYTTSSNKNWYYRTNHNVPTGNETGTLNSNRANIQLGVTIVPTPLPVVQVSPSAVVIGLENAPAFTWTPAATGPAPIGYKFYLGTDNPPANLIDGSDLNNILTYTPNVVLIPGTTYYWEVIPYNENGDAEGNIIQSFTTEEKLESPYLTITRIASPVARLDWNPVRGATSYRVYVSNDPYLNFSDWTLLTEVPTTTYTDTTDIQMRFYQITCLKGNR